MVIWSDKEIDMHDEVYTDGVGEITISGTVVRVDLISLSPTERDANNAPKPAFRQRLIFSIEGFAHSVELMQKALQGLVDAGAVTRTPPRSATITPAASRKVEPPPAILERPGTANASPNFG
jgi:hypothetical protein